MTDRLRVGVVGSGNIATIAQLPTLSARDDVDLVAVATHQDNPEQVQRRWGFTSIYRDLGQMLESEELDTVFVLTPRMVHAQNVEEALRAGKDVFCEKPLATTASEAQRLADLADDAGTHHKRDCSTSPMHSFGAAPGYAPRNDDGCSSQLELPT